MPRPFGQATPHPGRDLNGDQHVERHDTPRDSPGPPLRTHRNQDLLPRKVGVAVGDEPPDVNAGEDQGECPEEGVQIEQPCRQPASTNGLRRQEQTPYDRRGTQRPRHEARRTADVPRELRIERDGQEVHEYDPDRWVRRLLTIDSPVVVTIHAATS